MKQYTPSVLVTGASGFIGRYIVKALLDKAYTVRAQYRRSQLPRFLRNLESPSLECVRADLTDKSGITGLLPGIEKVVHVAGLPSDWGAREIFQAVNVDATDNLLSASQSAGVKQFIFISSISVHGFGPHRETAEDGVYYGYVSDYQRTKKEAEDIVLGRNGSGFRTLALRPGNVYGPEDTTVSYILFKAVRQGIMGYIGSGKTLTCPLYVEDLAQAVVLALEHEECGGEAFNITGGEIVTWEELLRFVAAELGVKEPRIHLPVWAARTAASVLKILYTVFPVSSAPPITTYRIDQMINDYHFSIDKARRVLGFHPVTDWREGYKKTVEDYMRHIMDERGKHGEAS